MKIVWTPDLAVDDPTIDAQHKELFRRVRALMLSIDQEKPPGYVEAIVGFLDEYVNVHFEAEERLMDRVDYPERDAHKREHARFIREWGRLKHTLERDGPSKSFAIGIGRVVVAWLRNHISVSDKALGRYLTETSKAA